MMAFGAVSSRDRDRWFDGRRQSVQFSVPFKRDYDAKALLVGVIMR